MKQTIMKTKKLLKKYYKSLRGKRLELQEKLYRAITEKSLKGKNTSPIGR